MQWCTHAYSFPISSCIDQLQNEENLNGERCIELDIY